MFLVAGGALGWLWKIFASFWFWLDSSLFDLIGNLYDILMMISRTTIFSQATIDDFKGRIQIFLGIFMLFKVGLSLIMYIVNPDDFSDQSKGIGKLVMNTVISLVLLVTVPYIFNMAYRIQAIVLEENVLAHLIFGDTYKSKTVDKDDKGKVTETYSYTYDVLSGGERLKFDIMLPFFQPNTGLSAYAVCADFRDNDGKIVKGCQEALRSGKLDDADKLHVNNYINGVENNSFELTFRLGTVTTKVPSDLNTNSDSDDDDTYLFDYKWPLTTIVAVVVCLLLINYCIDIAVRSIKLGFLQLISPIPIISYMDPKSGKDGMFNKWCKMCVSTYISLFVRLLALFFGIFIITNVDSIIDVISGATVTNGFVKIFVIIGVLFFIKQLPKILQDMGIKLDGDGKFNLNPFKRMEDGMLGGKLASRLPAAAGGAALGLGVGAVGTATGAGAGKWFTGMASGLAGGLKGKKIGELHKDQVSANSSCRL